MTLAEFLEKCDQHRLDIGSILEGQAQRWMRHEAIEAARQDALFRELASRQGQRRQEAGA
jgi:hypothetical protein